MIDPITASLIGSELARWAVTTVLRIGVLVVSVMRLKQE